MSDIFISYTSSDRDWAFWIAKALEGLGHTPFVHEWEIERGGDIYAWMEQRHEAADHVLCVLSDAYLSAPYSTLERNAALWQAAGKRPGFVLFVVVEPCKLPTLSDHIRRCELFGVPEDAAQFRFREFMAKREAPRSVAFPGKVFAVSNIPIRLPAHFMGRDDALGAIEKALKRYDGRVAITALHGLRGVGKTTLAAAYAERHRGEYRATWWIGAQSDTSMRTDFVALGVRLGWVAADDKEEPALAAVMERLRHEGEGILLIFDNALDASSLKQYLPRGGAAQVLVTSNAHAWRGIASPVEIRLWPSEIGADYLLARTGRSDEREAAETLSEVLGGLPLAHEQAAAYCERLEVSLADYRRRFAATPARLLDDHRGAPSEYHDGLTVTKTFALAIEEAAKLHPAAEPLIVHAARLAPEQIPLFLFEEGREKLAEPLAELLEGEGLMEAVAALRAFALVDRENVSDERHAAITTETIRLHRLVREVAAGRRQGASEQEERRALIEALAFVYPKDVFNDVKSWPRARRLDAHVLEMTASDMAAPGAERQIGELLNGVAAYRQGALGTYAQARPLYERSLAIREKALGADHPDTAVSLNNLAVLLQDQGDMAGARPLYERALAIREKVLGADHQDTAATLNNLAVLLQDQGDMAGARLLYERALAIREKALGPDHPHTAMSLGNLALLLAAQGDPASARPLCERALAITEKVLGPDHPETATGLKNLANLLRAQDDLAGASRLLERALAINEKTLGPEHPNTATSLNDLALMLRAQGDLATALPLYERALAIYERVLGPEHPNANRVRHNLARLVLALGQPNEALTLGMAALAAHETSLGRAHAWTKDSARVAADALDALGRTGESNELRAKFGLGAEEVR
ncbi:MAG: tetratricopeptide repeat protein [Hyphomicrobiales bacterium]